MDSPQVFWKKTPLWVAGGIVIGAVAMGTFISGSGLKLAAAQNKVAPTKLASLSGSGIAALEQLDEAFSQVSESVAPSVVHIRWKQGGDSKVPGMGSVGMAEGSGFIYRADGWIVTNDHVVSGAKDVTVVLNDGRELKGTVRRANDLQNDVALVKVDATDLPVAQIGDSGRVKMGQFAMAYGAPFGLENTLTVGHISATGRATMAGDQTTVRNYTSMIQTDAPINPGNSGGPLVNIRGEVIGVNTSIYNANSFMGSGGGNVGIGFAIPINQVRMIADKLISTGTLTRGYLGLQPGDLTPWEKKKLDVQQGAIVRDVQADGVLKGPAADAGLKKGDIVTKVGSYEIRGEQDLRNSMLEIKPGTKIDVEYLRDGKKSSTSLTVGKLPEQRKAANPGAPQGGLQMPDFEGDVPDLKDLPKQFRQFHNFGQKENTPDVKVNDGKAHLGVEVRAPGSDDKSAKGLIIVAVTEGSIAESLGLKAGDAISELNGVTLNSMDDLKKAMDGKKPGDLGHVKVDRSSGNSQSHLDLSFKY